MQFGKNRRPDSAVESGLPLTNYCQIEKRNLGYGATPTLPLRSYCVREQSQ